MYGAFISAFFLPKNDFSTTKKIIFYKSYLFHLLLKSKTIFLNFWVKAIMNSFYKNVFLLKNHFFFVKISWTKHTLYLPHYENENMKISSHFFNANFLRPAILKLFILNLLTIWTKFIFSYLDLSLLKCEIHFKE